MPRICAMDTCIWHWLPSRMSLTSCSQQASLCQGILLWGVVQGKAQNQISPLYWARCLRWLSHGCYVLQTEIQHTWYNCLQPWVPVDLLMVLETQNQIPVLDGARTAPRKLEDDPKASHCTQADIQPWVATFTFRKMIRFCCLMSIGK